MPNTILISDDYNMVGRRVHGRQVAPKHISEDEFAGQVVPPTPLEARLPGRDYDDD